MRKQAGEQISAGRYRKEIEANFNPKFFNRFAKPAGLILERTFNEICIENIDYVKDAAEKEIIVYASNHKSYTDPLLLGLVLYNNKLKQPHYAAGRNMFNIWSTWFLKSIGAFSVDRANKDPIYLNTLKDYVADLINNQKEFLLYYWEGGRSYDGKLKSPKLGILKAILESQNKDVFIIPVAMNYEQVLEDRILTAIGTKKGQRRFSDELKELFYWYFNYYPLKKDGKKRYSSKAYVTFSEPISLRDYGATRRDLKDIAERVIREIHKSKHISSTSVFAAATLGAAQNSTEVKISEIQKNATIIQKNLEEMVNEGMEYFLPRGIIETAENSVIIKEPKILQYYANNFIE